MDWTKIKEGLPDIGNEILVFCKLGEMLSYYAVMNYQGQINPGITHWTLLSEPKDGLD